MLPVDATLLATAALVGAVHTVLGPDHYVPFVAMSQARGWSLGRTLGVTAVCGLGHIAGSVALGVIGIAAGWAIAGVESVEGMRGNLAGWLLTGFGLAYLAWGVRRGYRNRPHSHWHSHEGGEVHRHRHTHAGDHVHVHSGADADEGSAPSRSITPWVLFTIFVFGPCEPLIPLLMYPAATGGWTSVARVTVVFGVTTVGVMLLAVGLARQGLERLASSRVVWGGLERWSDALAGLAVMLCGVAVTAGL